MFARAGVYCRCVLQKENRVSRPGPTRVVESACPAQPSLPWRLSLGSFSFLLLMGRLPYLVQVRLDLDHSDPPDPQTKFRLDLGCGSRLLRRLSSSELSLCEPKFPTLNAETKSQSKRVRG